MKKNTIKKIASDVLNERFETKKRFGIISNTKKFQEKEFKTFTEGLSKNELNSLKYLGNSQKLKELGLLKEGQMPGLFFINENKEQSPICLKDIVNAGGEAGSTGTAKICSSNCNGGCGECGCVGEVKSISSPTGVTVDDPVGMNSMCLCDDGSYAVTCEDCPNDNTGKTMGPFGTAFDVDDLEMGRDRRGQEKACPCGNGDMRPECCPKGVNGIREVISGCSDHSLLKEVFNMNENKTVGKGSCMEVTSSTIDHLKGNLEFRNCGGCPCGADCFCAGYVKSGQIGALPGGMEPIMTNPSQG